jgi:hypothetical protein
MPGTQVNLSEAEVELLRIMSERTGRPEAELVHEAVRLLHAQFAAPDRRSVLSRARGIWKDRDDLPELSELRREMNRG